MGNRGFKVLSVLGLLFGIGTVYLGETGNCACPAHVAGQPAPFNQFQAEVELGVVIIVVSAIGMAFSFRGPRATP